MVIHQYTTIFNYWPLLFIYVLKHPTITIMIYQYTKIYPIHNRDPLMY